MYNFDLNLESVRVLPWMKSTAYDFFITKEADFDRLTRKEQEFLTLLVTWMKAANEGHEVSMKSP